MVEASELNAELAPVAVASAAARTTLAVTTL